MPLLQLSLAVVGIDFPNKRGPGRRFAVGLLRPGDPVELRAEPTNKHDPRAVSVFDAAGVQLGYLTAERCGRISQLLARGHDVSAVFQRLDKSAAIIRVAFDGDVPALPPEKCHQNDEIWIEPA